MTATFMCSTRRSGERVMESVTRFLEKRLKLKVNREKSAVDRPWRRKFLGYSLSWHRKPRLKVAGRECEAAQGEAARYCSSKPQLKLGTPGPRATDPVAAGLGQLLSADRRPRRVRGTGPMAAAAAALQPWRQWKRAFTRARHLMRLGLNGATGVAFGHQWARPVVECRCRAHEPCFAQEAL